MKRLSENIYSISDMGKKFKDTPETWVEKDIEIDIVDENFPEL